MDSLFITVSNKLESFELREIYREGVDSEGALLSESSCEYCLGDCFEDACVVMHTFSSDSCAGSFPPTV